MIELVFVACLVASPGACEERSLTFLDRSGPVGCMMQAPPTLATWVDEHPQFRVASWRCQTPEKRPVRA